MNREEALLLDAYMIFRHTISINKPMTNTNTYLYRLGTCTG
jgi:hypothetical protein